MVYLAIENIKEFQEVLLSLNIYLLVNVHETS